jgi:Spy/CpxP family protein refolding chaperone
LGLPLRDLNLTEGQREQLRQLTQQHRQQSQPLYQRLQTAQEARQQALETLPVDEGRIRAAEQDLAGARAEVAVAQARLRADVFALLTPDQQTQAQKLRAEREARLKERRERMQQRMQQRQPRPQA